MAGADEHRRCPPHEHARTVVGGARGPGGPRSRCPSDVVRPIERATSDAQRFGERWFRQEVRRQVREGHFGRGEEERREPRTSQAASDPLDGDRWRRRSRRSDRRDRGEHHPEVPGSAGARGLDAVGIEPGSVERDRRGGRDGRVSRGSAHRFDAARRLRPHPPAVRWAARRDLGDVHRHRLPGRDPHRERGAFARARCGVDHLQPGSGRCRRDRHAQREGRRQVVHHDVAVPGSVLADLAAVVGSSARGGFRRRRADRPLHRLAAPEPLHVPGGRCELRDDPPRSFDPANPPPFDPSAPGPDAVPMDGGTVDTAEVQTDMQAPAGS